MNDTLSSALHLDANYSMKKAISWATESPKLHFFHSI